ncbi:unnamed protein product, partial [Symbiodinium necroappetens]
MEVATFNAQKDVEWPRCIPSIPELTVQEILYMDDSLIWSGSKSDTQKKYNILRRHLAEWGLSLNTDKTKYYASTHSTEKGPIELEGCLIYPAPSLEVFGIPLEVPLRPTKLMDTALTKAQNKFFANKELFLARGPLAKKLTVFQSVVAGAALWYCPAISPTVQAMGALNACQLELVAKLARIKRIGGTEGMSAEAFSGHSHQLVPSCRDAETETGGNDRGVYYPYLHNDEARVIRTCHNQEWHE